MNSLENFTEARMSSPAAKHPHRIWYAYVCLWTAVVIWSASYLASRVLLQEMPPLEAVVVRFFAASILLLLMVSGTGRRLPLLPRSEWREVSTLGVVLVTLGYSFEFAGIRLTSAGNSSVLMGLIPACTILLGRFLLRERITLLQWSGVAVASIGTVLLVGAGKQLGLSNPRGDLLVFAAMFLNAVANMLGRRSATRVDPLLHLAYAFALGALILVPFTLHDWRAVGLHAMRADGWWSLFYLVVPSTIIAYPCFFYGLSKTSLSSGSLPVYAVAPLTLLLSAFLLHEPLTLRRILATGIVVFGLLLASPRKWGKAKESLQQSPAEYTSA